MVINIAVIGSRQSGVSEPIVKTDKINHILVCYGSHFIFFQYCTVGYQIRKKFFYELCDFYVKKINPVEIYKLIQEKYNPMKETLQEFDIIVNDVDYVSDMYYKLIQDYWHSTTALFYLV